MVLMHLHAIEVVDVPGCGMQVVMVMMVVLAMVGWAVVEGAVDEFRHASRDHDGRGGVAPGGQCRQPC